MRRFGLFVSLSVFGCVPAGSLPAQTSPTPFLPPVLSLSPAPTPSALPVGSAAPNTKALLREVATYELDYYPLQFAFDSHGGVWINGSGSAFYSPAGEKPEKRFDFSGGFNTLIYIKAGDQLWRTDSGSGVAKIDGTGKTITSYPGPSGDWASQPFVPDGGGNVWVGYDFGQKLYKYAANGERLLDLDVQCIRGMYVDSQGRIVAGGFGKVTWLAPDGAIVKQRALGQNFSGFVVDQDDHIWAVEQDDAGTIYHLRPDDTLEALNPVNGPVGSLTVRGETIWFNAGQTLHRMDRTGKLTGSFDLGEGFSSLGLDPAGRFVWAGYQRKAGDRYVGVATKFAIQ